MQHGPWVSIGVLSLMLTTSATAQLQSDRHTLAAAIAAGLVTAVFRGTGGSSGDVITLAVAKTAKAGPGRLELSIPPGTQLLSTNKTAQAMVIAAVRGRMVSERSYAPASQIVVASLTPMTYVVEAYCAEFEKDNPSEATTFQLGSLDPTLACIVQAAGHLSTEATQAAVWMHTDRATYEHITAKFSVSRSDWMAAQAVVQRCQRLAH